MLRFSRFWITDQKIGIIGALIPNSVNDPAVHVRVNNFNSRVISFPMRGSPEPAFPPALSPFYVAD